MAQQSAFSHCYVASSCHDGSSSSEKQEALDGTIQSTKGPPKVLQLSQLVSSPTRRNIKAQELAESSTELQNPDQSEKPSEKKEEKAVDTIQKLGRTYLIPLYFYCTWCPVLIYIYIIYFIDPKLYRKYQTNSSA